MYSHDSFFDLSALGQVGLATLSLVLSVLMVLASRRVLAPYGSLTRIAGALVMFWLFVWMSPQVYYMYYRMIIPDLPLQWVIWPPRGPGQALQMLFFQYRANLSAHGQGILGWCLIAAPFVGRPWPKRKSDA
jgi:hypothetical protein